MNDNIEIRIVHQKGDELIFDDNLSYDEYSIYLTHIKQLNKYYFNLNMFHLLRFNFNDFIHYGDFFQSSYNKNTEVDPNELHYHYLNINRLFINFLTSFRSFIDHSEDYVKKEFGDKSKQLADYKKMISHTYDSRFEYRFFYKLRNYAQHINMPINSINLKLQREESDFSKFTSKLDIKFDIKHLLSNYDSWSSVKADLLKLDNSVEVYPLSYSFFKIIEEIRLFLDQLGKEKIIDSAEFLSIKFKVLMESTENIFIFYDIIKKENGNMTFTPISIPTRIIDFVLKNK